MTFGILGGERRPTPYYSLAVLYLTDAFRISTVYEIYMNVSISGIQSHAKQKLLATFQLTSYVTHCLFSKSSIIICNAK